MKLISLLTRQKDGLSLKGFNVEHPYWVVSENNGVFNVITYINDTPDAGTCISDQWGDAVITVIASKDSYDFSYLKEPDWFANRQLVPLILGTVIYTKSENENEPNRC